MLTTTQGCRRMRATPARYSLARGDLASSDRWASASGRAATRLALRAGRLAAPAATVRAQDTTRTTRLDSLARQLERAEARIDVLEKQVASQASTAPRTRTGVRMDLGGRLLVNAFGDTRRVNNVDNPQFVRPD